MTLPLEPLGPKFTTTRVVQTNKPIGVIHNEEGARDQCVDHSSRKCRRVVTHAVVSGSDWTTNSYLSGLVFPETPNETLEWLMRL
jgi:hypothetical protein